MYAVNVCIRYYMVLRKARVHVESQASMSATGSAGMFDGREVPPRMREGHNLGPFKLWLAMWAAPASADRPMHVSHSPWLTPRARSARERQERGVIPRARAS